MDKPRILIVDDDDDVRMQMKWALSPHYDVSLAEDGQSALEVLQKDKPRAVTLDLGLPPSPRDTREGLLALDNMLQLDPWLKVLVITGQDEKENGIEAIGRGAYDFFAKPVNIEELKVVLDRALSRVGGKGLFVKELEVAMAAGRADLAVHSLKDVPMDLPEGFELAAVLEREDPRDAFVSNHYASLDLLPAGAVVGTSSLRRQALISARYPQLVMKIIGPYRVETYRLGVGS